MNTVCVHGLGYIGLPTAAMLANHDNTVVGYDVSDAIVSQLESGEIHIDEPGLRAFVTQALESGNLEVNGTVVPSKYHMICVPTPFEEESKQANLEYIRDAGETLAPHIREGDTVILESTVPPGTTTDVLRPLLEKSGLEAGSDFSLVHCPETVLPGNIITELQQNDRIIGGINDISTETAVHLYESFVEGDIYQTNARTAEFVKLIQNTYRDTNIGLANEIAKIANEYEVNAHEAIQLANNHPRVDLLNPGPGVGGHCLPIDPWFLTQAYDQESLIERAREVNDGMIEYVIQRLEEPLGSLEGSLIAIFGVAYKGNIADTRQSPGLALARTLQERGDVSVTLFDPHVSDQTLNIVSAQEATTGSDAIVIMTDHDEFARLDPESLTREMDKTVVFDTKDVLDQEAWTAHSTLLTI